MPSTLRVLIAINTAVFLFQWLFVPFLGDFLGLFFRYDASFPNFLIQPWRLITYTFLHAGLFHFLFNMLWLWWMGRPVEERIGSRSFLVLYLGSGIAGALFDSVLSLFSPVSYVIGASGAVFGIMVAFAMLFPRMPITLFLLPPIEARYVVAGLIAIEILFLNDGSNIARLVHLGGALGGYLLMRIHLQGKDLSMPIRYLEHLFRGIKPKSKKRTVTHMRSVSDADVVEEVDQSELDEILEKISKKGYDGLTAEEKRKLFELSKKK